MSTVENVVVVGDGQAGFSVCEALRKQGYAGGLTLVGDEGVLPYQRPPLSKAYLLGEMALERLYFRPQSFFDENEIALRLSDSACRIVAEEKSVILSSGEALPFDKLVLAVGSSPITLPEAMGGALKGVHYIRNLSDADALAQTVSPGQSVLIVGGGYIGLEAAAVSAKLGMQVTLVEAGERILGRVASSETANYFRELHKSNGVEILEGTQLTALKGTGGSLTHAVLSNGQQMDIGSAVVGIGIRPNTALAETAGIEIENGICVDANCVTSHPDILAVGDCASFQTNSKEYKRLECVGHAIDHAHNAARTILGNTENYTPKPWFWSDQYDVKLQIVGLSDGYDRVIKRSSDGAALSHWYYSGSKLLAVDAMNDPRSYMVAKRLIESGKSPDSDLVADPQTEIKSLLKM
ncbi:NAD(P)/FAD-dependent oxidoreductase [Cognatishimia activa]|uniref:NAD(P)/FAD-dependent oxidoreductase n=1 Tax=Cognatishimia activa TaxID=1715691 RepID=UPI002230269B|nr:FAD-dependent oxidoreductase [Cognatishimia activa]UZD91288.1 FAD-dependent oxidoreductase [Cognatishimia activa]